MTDTKDKDLGQILGYAAPRVDFTRRPDWLASAQSQTAARAYLERQPRSLFWPFMAGMAAGMAIFIAMDYFLRNAL